MEAEPATPAQVRSETLVVTAVEQEGWNAITRVAFRFFFAYFVLYSFPFPLNSIPGSYVIFAPYWRMWSAIVVWVGYHILLLSYPVRVFVNGSADTTTDYIQVLCFLVLALTAAGVWSVLDRKRADYGRLYYWLRLYVRIGLGATLLWYGAIKVINTTLSDSQRRIPLKTEHEI